MEKGSRVVLTGVVVACEVDGDLTAYATGGTNDQSNRLRRHCADVDLKCCQDLLSVVQAQRVMHEVGGWRFVDLPGHRTVLVGCGSGPRHLSGVGPHKLIVCPQVC